MEKTLFLVLFLSYHVLSAQSKYTNPIIFLNQYAEKTGWNKWNDKSTLKLVYQDEGHTDGEAIFIYEGEHKKAQIGKDLKKQMFFQNVETPEITWFRNYDAEITIIRTPPNQIMAMYQSTFSSPCPELRITNGLVDDWQISEGTFEDKPVYILTQEVEDLGMKKLFYYDKDTLFRIADYVEKGVGAGATVKYSDFRQVQGVWIPFKETITGVQFPRNRFVLNAQFDIDVSEYFKLPEDAENKQKD